MKSLICSLEYFEKDFFNPASQTLIKTVLGVMSSLVQRFSFRCYTLNHVTVIYLLVCSPLVILEFRVT